MNRLIYILVLFTYVACSSTDNIDVHNYPVITTINEVDRYYNISLDTSGEYEKCILTQYYDNSTELDYTYDLLETDIFDPLYYSITVERQPSVNDAKQVYKIGKGAINFVSKSTGQGSIPIDSLKLPGDENHYAIRTKNGQPTGAFFTMRKGVFVYTLLTSGLYTSDHSLLIDLILPKIENLENIELKE